MQKNENLIQTFFSLKDWAGAIHLFHLVTICILFLLPVSVVSFNEPQGDDKIDFGLFNEACGQFEVRLVPRFEFESVITNIQFTLKWPENTVDLINFQSDYELVQQGPVFHSEGFNYAVFVSVSLNGGLEVNWLAQQEYTVLTFMHNQGGSGNIDIIFADDDWATYNNGHIFVELMGTDYTGIVYQEALDIPAGPCNLAYIRVILQGAWDAGQASMRTSINTSGNLPLQQPYDTPPWNYNGSETVAAFPDNIVDWVLVELRNATDLTILIDRRAGLLSKMGLVLETDFSNGLSFAAPAGDYFIVVKHRNHIDVMSDSPITLPNVTAPYDFTEIVLTQPYKHMDPRPVVLELNPIGSGKYGMIAGNIYHDGLLRYLGTSNDRGPILVRLFQESGSSALNAFATGYFYEDSNLDNLVLYLSGGGFVNDRAIILQNLQKLTGSPDLNTIYISVVPQITNP